MRVREMEIPLYSNRKHVRMAIIALQEKKMVNNLLSGNKPKVPIIT